jgi:hypothetical protein
MTLKDTLFKGKRKYLTGAVATTALLLTGLTSLVIRDTCRDMHDPRRSDGYDGRGLSASMDELQSNTFNAGTEIVSDIFSNSSDYDLKVEVSKKESDQSKNY